ncbi:very long-chain-fatty-acid--CoA ligase bubblegum-like isoform X2 [Condylostylus longicornis]|uniref:very long-chain-fatty-acid--CoA ligase bubblegum-like isoform X2 n=1 Tax=Condylostylus longicornis TaxID=2530218 RepID=UPI00244DD86F|nr:very long-chain-fatty-acid--CoA ligase bubblegum-like isoform X2 [Condylostylus longicornis]
MVILSECSKNSKIKPADSYWTINPEKCVKLKIEREPTIQPVSIVDIFDRVVKEYPNNPSLMYKNSHSKWTPITYKDYQKKVEHIAKSFIKLGLDEYFSVAVIAFNCPEWFISALAAIHAHGIITGVYTTNSTEATYHILKTSRTNVVIVDDTKQMNKIREIRHKLPFLKAVVQLNGPYESFVGTEMGYCRWSDLEEMDVTEFNEEYHRRKNNVVVNECCSVVFTSGTTGQAKGAMLSHDNILFACQSTIKFLGNSRFGEEVFVSYLPLSHIAAQVLEFYICLCYAGCAWFGDRDSLKGSLVNTLQAARPTRFFGVPRVYEKIHEKMKALGAQSNFLKKAIAMWGKNITLQHYMAETTDSNQKPVHSFSYKLVRRILMSKIKEALGLDRCVSLASDAFGMTETSAPHLVSPPDGPLNLESVGVPISGCDAKIINPDKDGNGELCLNGRNIFMGYIGLLEKTKEALDDEGYLHTGDIARIDKNGYVTITGRLKDIIITAGGENIAPIYVENLVKAELPIVSNAFLVGDRQKFVAILLALKTEINPDDMSPLDALMPEVMEFFKNLGCNCKTLKEVIEAGPCPIVLKSIQDGIDRANIHSISNAQKIQKFAILPHDFSIVTGELGPTMKVKRNSVVEKYKETIESFYREN